MKARSPDIIVNNSRVERYVGMRGIVTANTHYGVTATLENGEKVNLENQQFDYFSEMAKNSSQNENPGVKD